MISDIAKEDIEQMQSEGLRPTVADIIRLNAMGLKLEALQKKHAIDATEYLPRVAQLTPDLALRQPTIGHEIWIDKAERFLKPGDYQSALAVNAYALSRPAADLPDGDSPKAVREAVEAFCEECRDLTREQIYAAIDYVKWGADSKRGEYPPARSNREPDGSEEEDWKHCIAVGVLLEGHVALFGVSRADLEQMTRQQAEHLIRRAYMFHKLSVADEVADATGDYYATLNEIRDQAARSK